MIEPEPPPPVWRWYVAYCVAMAALYLLCLAGGVVVLVIGLSPHESMPADAMVAGVVFAVVSAPLLAAFAAAPLLPRRPWAWTYHLVMISIGLTSVCCMPASIPLLVHWLKPEAQRFFGRPG